MSKKAKDKNRKYQAVSDFSINDCANATVPLLRKKKACGDCNNTKKLMQLAKNTEEEKSEEAPEELEEQHETTVAEGVEILENWADYSFDIWWLISEQIMPEDILRFSLICRKTAAVVQMTKFWIQLYHRFYTPICDLPPFLQLHRGVAKQGNKRNIAIRSLFYTYSPFKLSINRRANRDPACLVGKRLETLWFIQQPSEKQQWVFIYKFTRRECEKKHSQRETHAVNCKRKKSPEENSHVLLISTRQFRPLPQFHGHRVFLKALTRPLASGFSEFSLKLEFEDYKRSTVQTITYESGVSVQVIDWFSPLHETIVKKLCDFSACEANDSAFFAN